MVAAASCPRTLRRVIPASVGGTYIAMLLMMVPRRSVPAAAAADELGLGVRRALEMQAPERAYVA